MALESTQPLTEMNTRNFLGGVNGGRRVRLYNLTAAECLENVGAPTSHNPPRPVTGIALPPPFFFTENGTACTKENFKKALEQHIRLVSHTFRLFEVQRDTEPQQGTSLFC
jgi:hypothetical protein